MQQAVIVQQQQTMQVRCPPGAYPGTQIQIADSRGRLMMVVVPNGIGRINLTFLFGKVPKERRARERL